MAYDYISRMKVMCKLKYTGDSETDYVIAKLRAMVRNIPAENVTPVKLTGANTNFQRITASPEALAAWIIESQKRDPSILWRHDDHGCADLDEDFECTDELQARCIVDWLNSPAERGDQT